MGRGHGSSRGSGASKQVGDASMRGMSQGLAKVLKEREEEIRTNDWFEAGTVYDEQGNVIFNNDHGKNGEVNLGKDFENRIITHNHPLYGRSKGQARADQGGSLSDTDMFLAARFNAKEIRAVTRNYTYSLRRPEKGWGIDSTNGGYVWKAATGKWKDNSDVSRAKRVYKQAYKKVTEARDAYYFGYKGDRSAAWRRSSTVFWHQVNREFAKQMGWDYSKTKVN